MKPKKNPTEDMNRKRGLLFILVVVMLMALIYAALEWRTPFDDGGYDLDEPQEEMQQPTDSTVILRTKAIKGDTVSDLK